MHVFSMNLQSLELERFISMKKYQNVEVSERQLEDLVRLAPELIEAGLEFVDHQSFTDRGPLDVILVDSGKSLVIAELKIIEDDSMLFQGIDYYDYVTRNLDGYARAYKKFDIDPSEDPRLFLIAPSFSVTMLNRIKWIDISLSLFTFQCIQFEGPEDDVVPVYKEITPPGRPERVETYSIEDHYNYITDTDVKNLAQELVKEMVAWNPDKMFVEAIKYAISIKFEGRVVAYMEPRRKHIMWSTYDAEENWTSQQINSQSDIDAFQPTVRAHFERIGGGP